MLMTDLCWGDYQEIPKTMNYVCFISRYGEKFLQVLKDLNTATALGRIFRVAVAIGITIPPPIRQLYQTPQGSTP